MSDSTLAKDDQSSSFGKSGGPIQVFYVPEGSRRKPIVDHAEDIYIWDTNGKRYVDACSGPVTCNLGHGNKRVLAAMRAQAEKVCYASRALFENQANNDLSDLVTRLAGPGLDRAFVVSGGSEATEAAIKLARQYAVARNETGRWKVLARNPSYHGASLGAASVSGDPQTDAMFGAVMRMMPRVPAPLTYRLPGNHNADTYATHCADRLEEAIHEEGPETVLAFIMEPIGGLSTGATVAPDHYYSRVREICTRHGIQLIFDEVMSGAGRTGTFLCADHWPDGRPDMVTLAKGIGAGYTPLGMVLASAEMVDTVAASGGFLHGHTYSANPLTCAVGLAVVEETVERGLMQNATEMGERLRANLESIEAESTVLGDVRGMGLLNAIEIVSDKTEKSIFPASANAIASIIEIGMELGLSLYSRRTAEGRYGEWLMVTPPLTVTAAQVDEITDLIRSSLRAFEKSIGR